MYKLCALAVLAGTLFSGTGQNQERPGIFTAGFVNGRVWQKLNFAEKCILLSGIHDGMVWFHMRANIAEGTPSAAAHDLLGKTVDAPDLQTGELSKMIDDIYVHPANLSLPVVELDRVAVSIFRGMTYEDAERSLLGTLRKAYNADTSDQH